MVNKLDKQQSQLHLLANAYLQQKGAENWSLHGIEREGLRVSKDGFIAQTAHAPCLGSPLTHQQITTDYAEALLEFITAPCANAKQSLADLQAAHCWVYSCYADELIWPGSMPCKINGEQSIKIAEYGSSNSGMMKHIYRRGLHWRYGRIMQSIAGVHYNFSLGDNVWQQLYANSDRKHSFKQFKNIAYMSILRNFHRHAWLLVYLFGASPAVDISFFNKHAHNLQQHRQQTAYGKYATCLRMSDLGYKSQAQTAILLCYNSLETYLSSIEKALRTPYVPYQRIGVIKDGEYRQLNANLLQIENEFYNEIRPKSTPRRGQSPSGALAANGIEYLEVRLLDLNPLLALGIDELQINFLDAFLMFCLQTKSVEFDAAMLKRNKLNLHNVATMGRDPNLDIYLTGSKQNINTAATELIQKITHSANLLDQKQGGDKYTQACQRQLAKVDNPDLLPSAQIVARLLDENIEFADLMLQLASEHRAQLCQQQLTAAEIAHFKQLAQQSLSKQRAIENNDKLSFEEYLARYNAQNPSV